MRMKRKPKTTAKGEHLGIRVDAEVVREIDAEIAEVARDRPGLVLTRSDIVRMWITAAIQRKRDQD